MTHITERIEIEVPEILARHAVPGVALVRTKPEVGPGTPGCWFGGRPTLPAHIPWPMNDEFDPPMPMHFLCQLDLTQYPVAVMDAFEALPRAGTLFFFYDAVYGGVFTELWDASAVIYVEESLEGVPERDPPPMPPVDESCTSSDYLEKGGNAFPHWLITLYEVDTYPVDWWRQKRTHTETRTEEYERAWENWSKQFGQIISNLCEPERPYGGGYPTHFAVGALGSTPLGDEGKYNRLLYIQTDTNLRLKVGDAEHISFYIENGALKEKHFTKAETLCGPFEFG